MKFTLTISDMTAEGLTEVVTGLGYADHPLKPQRSEPSPLDVTIQAPEMLTHSDVEPVSYQLDNKPAHATGELDSKGLPWDERIHSGAKTQNKDGSWKYRKGVDDGIKAVVEAELRGQTKAAALPVEATPVMQTAPVVDPLAMFGQHPRVAEDTTHHAMIEAGRAAMSLPEQPVTPQTIPQPAVLQAAPQGVTMQTLMAKFQELLFAKKIAPNFAMELVQHLNATYGTQYTTIANIADNQQMLDAAMQYTVQRAG